MPKREGAALDGMVGAGRRALLPAFIFCDMENGHPLRG